MTRAAVADPPAGGRGAWLGTLAGAAIGAAFLSWIAGTRPLAPTDVDWTMKLDWAEHVFGWHYLRVEPWHWPPGTIRGYFAPLGTSIGLTDSIPLVAFALKPFDRWLPPLVQYLGLWWLVCFTLQGALGARLASRVSASAIVQALAATLFVLVPSLLARVGHAALCSHWLLLWAVLIATRPARLRPLEWALLGAVAGLIQPYLAVMVLALLGAVAIRPLVPAPAATRVAAWTAAVATTLGGWWLSGMFILQGEASLNEGGLGYYSMNLLGPITPQGFSLVLPALPVATDGQVYEGFHYLGLGLIALLAAAAVLARRRIAPAAAAVPGLDRLFAGMAALLAVFALSPVVTLGRWTLVDLNGPWVGPLAAFRSSGRFFWPLTYVAVLWAVGVVCRRLSTTGAIGLLSVAVALQVVDLHGAHRARYDTARSEAFYAWPQPFRSARWASLAAGQAHVVVAPPPQCGRSPVPYEPVLRFAATHGLTANVGVVSRVDVAARTRYCTSLAQSVAAGVLKARTLYVLDEATAAPVRAAAANACEAVDGLWACRRSGPAATP